MELIAAVQSQPSYPRQLAELFHMQESHISEYLNELVKLEVLESKWGRIEGKNVKLYSANTSSLELKFSPSGYSIALKGREGASKAEEYSIYLDSDVPRPTPVFVGRRSELRLLLNSKESPVFVWGLPGIGKTSLVAKYLESLWRTTAGQGRIVLWHDLREVDTSNHLLTKIGVVLSGYGRGRLLQTLSENGKDERLAIDAGVRELHESAALLVIDNFQYCNDDKVRLFLKSLLEEGPRGCKLVVISRIRPTELLSISQGSVEIRLEGLSRREAVKLAQIHGIEETRFPEFVAAQQRVGGHPLALGLFCQSIGHVKKEGQDGWSVEDYIVTNLLEAIDGEEELETLLNSSVFREPVPLDALRKVVPVRGLARHLSSLERRGVLTRVGDKYAIHDLVRNVAYGSLDSAKELHGKAGRYYLKRGDTRSTLEALYHFGSGKEWDEVIKIIDKDTVFIGEGFISPYMKVLEDISKKEIDERASGWIALGKGRTLQALETRLDEAIELLRRATLIAKSHRDYSLAARAFLYLGYAYKWKGNLPKALSAFGRGLENTRTGALEPFKEAILVEAIIEILVWNGEYDEALEKQAEILEIYRKAGSKRDVLTTLANRGIIHLQKGEPEPSVHELSEALGGLTRMGKKREAGITRLNLALAHWELGREGEAIQQLEKAIRDLSATSANALLLEAYATRATLLATEGKTDAAEADMAKARKLRETVERKLSLGIFEMAEGVVSMAKGELAEGRKHFDTSQKLSADDEWYLGRSLKWRGIMESRAGNMDAALKHLYSAREVFTKLGSRKPLNDVECEIKRIRTEWR